MGLLLEGMFGSNVILTRKEIFWTIFKLIYNAIFWKFSHIELRIVVLELVPTQKDCSREFRENVDSVDAYVLWF